MQTRDVVRGEDGQKNTLRQHMEAAKLKALQDAARQGWDDIDAGRYVEVPSGELEAFVGRLGDEAAQTRTNA